MGEIFFVGKSRYKIILREHSYCTHDFTRLGQDRRKTGAGPAQEGRRTGSGRMQDRGKNGARTAQDQHKTAHSRKQSLFFFKGLSYSKKMEKEFLGIGRLLEPMNYSIFKVI